MNMAWLILGLVVFLGVHSVRIVADGWRARIINRVGEGPWKGAYTLLSLLGFALIVWGFGQARQTPVVVWQPPTGMRHASALLTLIAFVFLAAAYVPRNAIKAKLHHPMVPMAGWPAWCSSALFSSGPCCSFAAQGSVTVPTRRSLCKPLQRPQCSRSCWVGLPGPPSPSGDT